MLQILCPDALYVHQALHYFLIFLRLSLIRSLAKSRLPPLGVAIFVLDYHPCDQIERTRRHASAARHLVFDGGYHQKIGSFSLPVGYTILSIII